jgi:RsiW-degrading membrane proteinase PrsW (M82 family)
MKRNDWGYLLKYAIAVVIIILLFIFIEWLTGLPDWVWWIVGGVILGGVIALIIYSIKKSKFHHNKLE